MDLYELVVELEKILRQYKYYGYGLREEAYKRLVELGLLDPEDEGIIPSDNYYDADCLEFTVRVLKKLLQNKG